MKKNNTAEKAILDAKKISNALKESTEKTLQSIVAEAIKSTIGEGEDFEQEEDTIETGDSLNGNDVETAATEIETDVTPEMGGEEEAEEPEVTDIEGEEEPESNEWSELDDFKVGDNEFDFTGVEGDMAVNVYNKLGDDDEIVVKKEGDGTFEFKDEETGAEYVIELDPNGESQEMASAEDDLNGEEEPEIEISDEVEEPEEDEDEGEIEIEIGNDEDETEEQPEGEEEEKEEEPLNEEDLGYTDNYQDKDPIEGLKNHETAPNGAKDWNKGIPTDTKKPWAGKGEGKPFEEKVNENVTTSKSQKRKEVKTMAPDAGEKDKPEVTKVTSVAGEEVNENFKKIVAKAKAILAENKQYKQAIDDIKKSLYEAAVLNVNYGKLVSLLVNETVSKDEKKSIVERFSNVKTINEGKQLYDTIKHELNETKKSAPIIEHAMGSNSSKTINETPIYQTENASINLMERMENLYKKKTVINESTTKSNDALDLMNRMDNLHKH